LIIFGPAGTPVEHGSYADLLLIAIALSSFLLALPRWVPPLVLALEIANLLFVWMPFRPVAPFIPIVIQWPLVAFAVVSGALLAVFTVCSLASRRHRDYELLFPLELNSNGRD
jgi:hypothetical protein